MNNIDIPFIEDVLSKIYKNNKDKGYILRKDITDETMGFLTSLTMASYDYKGTGIKGAFRIKNRVAYPLQNVLDFIREKTLIYK